MIDHLRHGTFAPCHKRLNKGFGQFVPQKYNSQFAVTAQEVYSCNASISLQEERCANHSLGVKP